MSIPVPPRSPNGAVADRGAAAFVLTVSDRGTLHVVRAEVSTGGGGLIAVVGAGTAHNAGQRPHVSVLFPCRRPDDYSLIVDAGAKVAATPRRLPAAPRADASGPPPPGTGARSGGVTVRVRLHPVTPGCHELIPRSWRLLDRAVPCTSSISPRR